MEEPEVSKRVQPVACWNTIFDSTSKREGPGSGLDLASRVVKRFGPQKVKANEDRN
jgi:hypothetical protein